MMEETEMYVMDDAAIRNDVPQVLSSLREVKASISGAGSTVKRLKDRLCSGELSTNEGNGLVEVKIHMMLNYLINLTHLMLLKCHGKSIENNEDIRRLIEYRTVLERMRPIEHKLKYYLDRLLKLSSGVVNEDDPLNLRPRPLNIVSKFADDDEADGIEEPDYDGTEGRGGSAPASRLFKASKLSSVSYDGDLNDSVRKQTLLEKAQKRALGSSVIRELQSEFSENPVEITDKISTYGSHVETLAERERREYEEEHFTRLPPTKHDLKRMRQYGDGNNLDSITHFRDISALTGGRSSSSKKRKRKSTSKKGKKSKGLRRKRRR